MKHKIGILGAGTWGMALARMLTVSGNDVTVWSALEQEIDNLSTTRVHPNLPGMTIPAEMKFTKSVEEVCTDKEILLFAVPSVFVRSTAAKARPFVPDGQIIVDVAKGIEKDTLFTMTEILADELGKEGGPKGVRLVALSGPALADAVADGVIAQRGAEFFAQGGDVDADGIAEAVHAVVPNVIHQLLLTHGPPLMHHQVFEYPRFLSGQRQRLPIDSGGAGAGVEAQASAA